MHKLSSSKRWFRKTVNTRSHLMHSSLDVAAGEPLQLLASLQEQAAVCTRSGLE